MFAEPLAEGAAKEAPPDPAAAPWSDALRVVLPAIPACEALPLLAALRIVGAALAAAALAFPPA